MMNWDKIPHTIELESDGCWLRLVFTGSSGSDVYEFVDPTLLTSDLDKLILDRFAVEERARMDRVLFQQAQFQLKMEMEKAARKQQYLQLKQEFEND